jgi:hypothetical protein
MQLVSTLFPHLGKLHTAAAASSLPHSNALETCLYKILLLVHVVFCGAGIIVLKGSTRATFDNCSFVDNRADYSQGGAVYVREDATVLVRNSNFEDNVAL